MIAVDVPDLLRELGIKAHRAGATELVARCPHPDHHHEPGSRGKGSWRITTQEGLHHCFSCGFKGSPVSLFAAVRQVDKRQAIEWLRARYGGEAIGRTSLAEWPGKDPPRPQLRYPAGTIALWSDPLPPEVAPALAYVRSRGLTYHDVRRYRIGATPPTAREYAGRVIVPVVVRGVMVDLVARDYLGSDRPKALSGRADRGAEKALALWGVDDLPDLDLVVIVEGVWGAVALRAVLGDRVVAACGSAWSSERTDLLAGAREVVAIPDGDDAGRLFGGRLRAAFGGRCRVVDLPEGGQPDGHVGDIYSYLLKNRESNKSY